MLRNDMGGGVIQVLRNAMGERSVQGSSALLDQTRQTGYWCSYVPCLSYSA